MTRGGIVTSINSDLPHQIRHLNVEAAKTMKYGGLTEHEALAQLTRLGVEVRPSTMVTGIDETGVSVNTLLSRKRYAVLHLRERLQDIYDEFRKA